MILSTTLHECNEDSRTSHASSQLPFHYSTPNGSNGCIGYCLCLHHHTVPTLQTPVSKSCVPASTSCIHSIGHLRLSISESELLESSTRREGPGCGSTVHLLFFWYFFCFDDRIDSMGRFGVDFFCPDSCVFILSITV